MHKIILMLLCDNTWKYLNQNLNILIKSFIFLFPPTFMIFVTCLSLIFIILTVFSYKTKISNQVFISISNHGSLLIFFLTNLSNPTFWKSFRLYSVRYVLYNFDDFIGNKCETQKYYCLIIRTNLCHKFQHSFFFLSVWNRIGFVRKNHVSKIT